MLNKLLKLDKENIKNIINNLTDLYGDFYITRQRIRYSIKENVEILFKCISDGDKIITTDDGLVVVVGFSDKAPRKYVKLLAKDNKTAELLLQGINAEVKEDLFVKIKKNNPFLPVFKKNGYKFKGSRGKEILLVRELNKET